MAHKKGLGSSRNGRDSKPKFLGVKVFAWAGGRWDARRQSSRFGRISGFLALA